MGPAALVLGLALSGCDGGPETDPDRGPVILVVSDTWVAGQQAGPGSGGASGGSVVRTRIAGLQQAIVRLRDETRTGWTGRQDDVTGYLAELTGGSRPGTPADFMEAYGPALFGVEASALRLDDPDSETVPGVITTKAVQAVGEVPVLDSTLVFTSRDPDSTGERLAGVRGRVFPGLAPETTPTLTAEQAAAAAASLAGGTAEGAPTLVVVPTGEGVLAWEVTVLAGDGAGAGAGRYYVDALTGDLVTIRAVSSDLAVPVPAAHTLGGSKTLKAGKRSHQASPTRTTGSAPEANSVEVSGADPLGRELTGFGLQTGAGVELTDTTTPAWDSVGRTGAISTYDATRVRNEGQLPGELWVSGDTRITDPEVIAAQAYSHDIIEYFEGLGRSSWDGEGGTLINSVNFGPANHCNASFFGFLRQPQMVYGNPCTVSEGVISNSLVEPDVAAHEITHGVTQTSAGLLYAGQSGALNESFSDYFGNVIGNLIHGDDSVAVAEDACAGFTEETRFCSRNPDGTLSLRYMLNGTDFDDYLRVLNPGFRLELLEVTRQDYGGVHINSAIWNNALWSIRTQLAKIDNLPGNDSPLAKAFDRAVYGALATRLTPTSSFVDARNGVEQVIIDSGLDPVVLRIAREIFDQNKICSGCPTTGELAGDGVATGSQEQLHPSVSGNRALWLDISAGSEFIGYPGSAPLDGSSAPSVGPTADSLEVTFAGEAVVSLDVKGRVVRVDDSGTTTVLASGLDALRTLAAGLSGSDAGAAWLGRGDVVSFVDPSGTVTAAEVPGLQGDTVVSIGTGGGTVAIGTDGGKIFRWSPGRDAVTQVGSMPGAVLATAAYGGNVFAIDDTRRSVLIEADGSTFSVSSLATPFGATMSEEYAVWAEATGPIDVGVAPDGSSGFPETDLYLLSLATGQVYNLHPAPAQQGFPAISGRRLVWQDATFGGDDIFTAVVPGGL